MAVRSIAGTVLAVLLLIAVPVAEALPWDQYTPAIASYCAASNFTPMLGVPLVNGTVWHSIVYALAASMPGVVAPDDQYATASYMTSHGCSLPAKPPSVVAWEIAHGTQNPPPPAGDPNSPPPTSTPWPTDAGPGERIVFGADGQTSPRLRWNPLRQAACIGLTDEACDELWPDERNVLLRVVGVNNGVTSSDASIEVWQLTDVMNDTRGVGCFNALAQPQPPWALTGIQMCAYSMMYPEGPFRGRGKLGVIGPRGALVNLYDGGDFVFAKNSGAEGFLTINGNGLGVHDKPDSGCVGCLSLGVGSVQAVARPWWGVDLTVKIGADGNAYPAVRLPSGAVRRIMLE